LRARAATGRPAEPASRRAIGTLSIGAVPTALLSSAVCLAVYLLTLAPTAFAMDSAELAAAAYSLGLAHAPGYSVYLLVAHLFTYLPVGDVAFRVNLLSALAGSACIGLLTYQLKRSLGSSAVALSVGLALGFSYYAWAVSVAAEVYTLQSLLLMAILVLAWDWRLRGRRSALVAAAGLIGLSLANNPATLLWWPGLGLLLWASPHRKRLGLSDAAKMLAALMVGLSFIGYIPWRSAAEPAFVYVGWYDREAVFKHPDLTRPSTLLWYLSGQPFAAFFPALVPSEVLAGVTEFIGHLWALMLGVGLPLGLVGVARQLRRHRTWALGLLAVGGLHVAFFAVYRAGDRGLMLLPAFLIWSFFVADGMQIAAQGFHPRWQMAGLLLPVALLLVNWSYLDLSSSESSVRLARARLRAARAESVYVLPWGEAAVMHYLQIVDGVGDQVTVVNSFFVDEETLGPLVQTAIDRGRAVYTSQANLLPAEFGLGQVGSSYLVIGSQGVPDE